MPDEIPIVPNVPTTPIVGQQNQPSQRQTKSQQRQQTLDRIAQEKSSLFRRVYYKTIQRGSLVSFQYMFWKHDPYPLVLCSGIYQDGRIGSVNLHYMTFKYIRYLIQQYCGKQFTYYQIKGNQYIYNSFRSYKRDGIRTAKLMDCEFLMTILGSVRSFRPNEIEAIRKEVQRQLRARMNQSADEMAEEYSSSIVPNPNHPKYSNIEGYQPLEKFGEPHWPNAMPPLNRPKPTIGDRRFNPDNLTPP